jgi:RES domain-containing protein
VKAFRLAPRTFAATAADAFSGLGGLYADGRWNVKGVRIVHTASSLSLASLELLAHLQRTTSVAEHVYYVIDVPDRLIVTPTALPSGWDCIPPTAASRAFGATWLRALRSVGLVVPSVVIPLEFNLLLNPAHPEFSLTWVVSGPHLYRFDPRHLT